MSEYNINGNVASENSAARERGASVAREYERVVNTFNKVLLLKEKIRLSVEHRISELENFLARNEEQLGTLSRNIEIYELNISRSVENLEDLLIKETRIKDKYYAVISALSATVQIGDEDRRSEVSTDLNVFSFNLTLQLNFGSSE